MFKVIIIPYNIAHYSAAYVSVGIVSSPDPTLLLTRGSREEYRVWQSKSWLNDIIHVVTGIITNGITSITIITLVTDSIATRANFRVSLINLLQLMPTHATSNHTQTQLAKARPTMFCILLVYAICQHNCIFINKTILGNHIWKYLVLVLFTVIKFIAFSFQYNEFSAFKLILAMLIKVP